LNNSSVWNKEQFLRTLKCFFSLYVTLSIASYFSTTFIFLVSSFLSLLCWFSHALSCMRVTKTKLHSEQRRFFGFYFHELFSLKVICCFPPFHVGKLKAFLLNIWIRTFMFQIVFTELKIENVSKWRISFDLWGMEKLLSEWSPKRGMTIKCQGLTTFIFLSSKIHLRSLQPSIFVIFENLLIRQTRPFSWWFRIYK